MGSRKHAHATSQQTTGHVWQWTRSAYDPYPGFKPLPGIAAEYNGKFMVGQLVLRGGSSATPAGHTRPTYRNFFPPSARWQFSGVRLARDIDHNDNAARAASQFDDDIVIHGAQPDFARDLLRGFERRPRSIAPKYFYDAAGSALFDRICALPEYYQTRTELSILQRNAAAIAQQIGPHADIVEFGAGSLTKIRLLLDGFGRAHAPQRYLPIDISADHLQRRSRTPARATIHTSTCSR